MQHNKKDPFVMVLILIFSLIAFSGMVSAQDTPDNIIQASFDFQMLSATELAVYVELDVSKITRTGRETSYTAEDISSLASSSSTSDLLILGAIENELSILTLETLQNIFQDSKITTLKELPDYENSIFYDEYNVNLTSPFFGLNATINSYEFINAILDMGANITYGFNLMAKHGWNNTFKFILSEKMSLYYANTANVGAENTEIIWSVNNYNGLSTGKTAVLSIKFANPTTTQPKKENLFLEFNLDAANADPTKLNIIANVMDVPIDNYDITPSFVDNLNYITSDGLRLFVKNGLITWEEFKQKTLDEIEEGVIDTVETTAFNQTIDLTFSWDKNTTDDCPDPYDINNMDNNPAVKAIFSDEDIDILINDLSTMAVFGLVKSGASVNVTSQSINFGQEIKNIGYNYNLTFSMPDKIVLQEQNQFTWNDTISFSGEIISEDPPEYNEEKIDTIIEIEIESTDLNLISFFTGNTELSFGLNIEQEKNYNVLSLPDEFSLPNKISIDFLNSDAFRICLNENVFSQESIDCFLLNDKIAFENILQNVIPGLEITGSINKNTFQDSLKWETDISQISDLNPVKTLSYSHKSHPVKFSLGVVPPSFEIPRQKYNFTGLPGQTVTYKMIFPSGINIDINNQAEIKETNDGRKYFEITFTPDESESNIEISCKIQPSVLFLVGLFIPCILSIFITIILLVVIVIIRRKRRGGRGKKQEPVYYEEPTEEPSTGYEDEEYYIPPPPGSK